MTPHSGRPIWLDHHRVTIAGLTLDDVIGLDEAKAEVRSLVARLRYPEVILRAGGEIPKGVLFWGPPGCGKSYLSRVMAGLLSEGGDRDVDFFSFNAGDLTQERLEELSIWLDGLTDEDPRIIVFIDEIDTWGRDRDDYRHSDKTRDSLMAALSCIDGIRDGSRNRVLFLATSNRPPRLLDSALVRPGRFGFWVRVTFGDRRERTETFRYYARTRRHDPSVDWERAADLAGTRASPAAIKQALDDSLARAIADKGPDAAISWDYLSAAILRGGEVEQVRPFSDEDLYSICIHEASHAIVAAAHGRRIVSISASHHQGGRTDYSADDETAPILTRKIRSAKRMRVELQVTLAGIVGERLICGDVTLGSNSDLGDAMDLTIELLNNGVDDSSSPVLRGQLTQSPRANDDQYLAIVALITVAMRETEQVVMANREKVEAIARRLAEAKHLSGETLRDLMRDLGFNGVQEVAVE